MTEIPDLEHVTKELSEIQDQLLALPDDGFAERYELQKRQDQLRKHAAGLAVDWDDQRSTDDLEAELAELKSRAEQVVRKHTGHATGHGGGYGGGGVSAAVAKLANEARASSGVDQVLARINAIQDALARRQPADPLPKEDRNGHHKQT